MTAADWQNILTLHRDRFACSYDGERFSTHSCPQSRGEAAVPEYRSATPPDPEEVVPL